MSQYFKHANGVDWATYCNGEIWWVGERFGFWSFARHNEQHEIVFDIERPVFKTRAKAIQAIPNYIKEKASR